MLKNPGPAPDARQDETARVARGVAIVAPAFREAWKTHALPALALALLVAIGFFPAFQAGFVWDDVAFTEEPEILKPSGLKNIWFSPSDIRNEGHYWPLTYTTFWLEHQVWGLQPLGYHVVNVLLHLANVLLLWRLLARLPMPGAWAAAAVFAIHPLHVESVVWVIERKDVLSGLLYLTSIAAYLRFVETRRAAAYAGSLALFAAALLSKSVAVTLPAALLVWHWWKRGRIAAADLRATAPFFLVGLAISLGDLTYYRSREEVLALDYSLVERLLIAGRALWFYAGKLLWPTDLAVIYPLWEIRTDDLAAWTFVFAAVALAAALWLARHRLGRGPLAGLAFFAVTLSPVLGFVDYGYMLFSFVADRYQYLAGAGLIAVVVAAAVRGAARFPASWAVAGKAALGVVLVVLGTLTWRQAGIYRDSVTFFSHIVALNPEARDAHYNLSLALRDDERHEESLEAGRIAVDRRPEHPEVQSSLGVAFLNLNRFEEAEASFERALELAPRHRNAHQNLGETLRRQGRYEEAVERFRTVLEIDGAFTLAWTGLGQALFRSGQHEEAAAAAREGLAIAPDGPDAGDFHFLLGQALRELDEFGEAERNLLRAAELSPEDPRPLVELAVVYGLMQRPDEADAYAARARALQPEDPAPLHARGEALRLLKRYDEALAVYGEALEMDPEYAPAIAGIGIAMLDLGRREEALERLDRALRLDPDLPDASSLHRLAGRALFELDRPEDAAERFERCLELDPADTEALDYLALLRFSARRYEEALDLYRRLAEADPASPLTHMNIGIILLALERHDEAARSLERSLELDPDQETARRALADARRGAGQER